MYDLLLLLARLIFKLFPPETELLIDNHILKKQLEILERKNKKQIKTRKSDRVFFSILNAFQYVKRNFKILKPATLLSWQNQLRKHYWTFNKNHRIGRPPVSKVDKALVIDMKNRSLTWGIRRIQGELLKININLGITTTWNILRLARKQGKINSNFTWKKFLRSQIHSMFAMDFFVVDTVFNKRYYVYFIIHHKTREIIQYAITENPVKEFVRQQLIVFKENFQNKTYMIHDGSGEFIQNYLSLGINHVRISYRSPNMNAIAERVIRSIREDALDNFLIFSRRQIKWILSNYIEHYNSRRPHQSLSQQSPKGYIPEVVGRVKSKSVLGGLFHDYYRASEALM